MVAKSTMLLLAVLLSAGAGYAQQATEIYIPLGQSPGLSGKYAVAGPVQSLDAATRRLTVAGREFRVTAATRIWIDRSAAGQRNRRGAFTDLRPGASVEVMYVGPERQDVARWIKIREDG